MRRSAVRFRSAAFISRCGSVWLEHRVRDAGVAGSNPVTSTTKRNDVGRSFFCRGEHVYQSISAYVLYYNKQRPCYSIGYDTPDHYYSRYMSGELEKKDTFSKRVLSETPKFVQKRKTGKEQ